MNHTRRLFVTRSLALTCWASSAAMAADTVPVTASFSILGDLVRVVGGERVHVTTLAGTDQDAHTFEPKPTHAKTILGSRLMVVNGLGFEPWAYKLAKSAGFKGETVVASKGIQPQHLVPDQGTGAHRHGGHETADPHAWQNPNHVVQYVRNIAAALSKVDASGAARYQANAEAYVKELHALDAWAKMQLAAIPLAQRKVITSHGAFGYLAAHYQIKFLAPQGVNTDAQPSAKQVAELIRQIQREKIRAVFIENMNNPRLLAQISQDTGVSMGATLYADALSGPDQPGSTYLDMMRHNVTQLAAGMKLN